MNCYFTEMEKCNKIEYHRVEEADGGEEVHVRTGRVR